MKVSVSSSSTMAHHLQQPPRKNVRQTVEHVCGLLHAIIPSKTGLTPEHIRRAKFNHPSASPFLLQVLLDLSRLNPNCVVLAPKPVPSLASTSSRSDSSSTRSSYAGSSSSSDKNNEHRNRSAISKTLSHTQDQVRKPDKVSALILLVKNGRIHSEKPTKTKGNPNSRVTDSVKTKPNPNAYGIERKRGKGENPQPVSNLQRKLPGNETLAISRPSSRSKSTGKANQTEPHRNTLRNLNLSTAPYDDSAQNLLTGRPISRKGVNPVLKLLHGGSVSSKHNTGERKRREDRDSSKNRELTLVQNIRDLATLEQRPSTREACHKFLEDNPKDIEMKLESVKLSLSKWGYPDDAPIFALTSKNLDSRPMLLALGWLLSFFNLFEQVLSCRVESLMQVRSKAPLAPYPADVSCTDDALTIGREAETSAQAYMKKIAVSLDVISDVKVRSAARAQQVLLMYGKVIHCMKGLVSLKQSKEQLAQELDDLQQQKNICHPLHNRSLSQYEIYLLQHKDVFTRHIHALQAEKMILLKVKESKCHQSLFQEWMDSVMDMSIADNGECNDDTVHSREFFFYKKKENGEGCNRVPDSGKVFTDAETSLLKIQNGECCKQANVKSYIVEDEIERFKVLETKLHQFLACTQAV